MSKELQVFKLIAATAVVVFVAGCTTPQPKQAVAQTIDRSQCRAIEGAPVRMDRKGNSVYKYICNGQGVWLSDR